MRLFFFIENLMKKQFFQHTTTIIQTNLKPLMKSMTQINLYGEFRFGDTLKKVQRELGRELAVKL